MDLPKSGAKCFFEILMPGVFLLLNMLGTFGLFMVTLADSDRQRAVHEFLVAPTYALALILSLGYLLGVVLRLFRTQFVDNWSGWFIGLLKPVWRDEPFITDPFFYNRWMRNKCNKRFDPFVGQFYERYWAQRDTGDAFKNTSFFNMCKVLINKTDPNSANEVFAAEAMSRFVAGSFYALFFACMLAFLDAIIVWEFIGRRLALLPIAVALVYFLLMLGILWEFRFLRCKEVDAVFDACYANRQHFQEYFRGDDTLASIHEKRIAQQRILEVAWRHSLERGDECPSLDIDSLVASMRESCKDASFLSSLYFAGADVDHPYFLKNKAIAVGIAVLPEDVEKAGRPRRHPHQVEVVFVLQGSLRLHSGENSNSRCAVLAAGDYQVIKKDVRHWITPHERDDAIYAFVKTNPTEEPRSVDA
jgi:hypothetical protein